MAGGLGVGVIALVLAWIECGPELGVQNSEIQPAVSEGEQEGDTIPDPLVLEIRAAEVLGPDGPMPQDIAAELATARAAAGSSIEIIPGPDALDRTVHDLTQALDAAGVDYVVRTP